MFNTSLLRQTTKLVDFMAPDLDNVLILNNFRLINLQILTHHLNFFNFQTRKVKNEKVMIKHFYHCFEPKKFYHV